MDNYRTTLLHTIRVLGMKQEQITQETDRTYAWEEAVLTWMENHNYFPNEQAIIHSISACEQIYGPKRRYATLVDLCEATDTYLDNGEKLEDEDTMNLHINRGNVYITNEFGQAIYEGNERESLIELMVFFIGIGYTPSS